MKLNITATKTTLTPAIRNAVSDKLARLEKFILDEDVVHVEFSVDKKHKSGLINRVEISINPPKFYAEARGNDFYEALDLVIPKMKEQLAKIKDMVISKRRKAARRAKGIV